jgi:hypothetical protein
VVHSPATVVRSSINLQIWNGRRKEIVSESFQLFTESFTVAREGAGDERAGQCDDATLTHHIEDGKKRFADFKRAAARYLLSCTGNTALRVSTSIRLLSASVVQDGLQTAIIDASWKQREDHAHSFG